MNDRHNRIAGCQAAVDAAREQVDIAARRLAEAFAEWVNEDSMNNIATLGASYHDTQHRYAAALDELADAIRR